MCFVHGIRIPLEGIGKCASEAALAFFNKGNLVFFLPDLNSDVQHNKPIIDGGTERKRKVQFQDRVRFSERFVVFSNILNKLHLQIHWPIVTIKYLPNYTIENPATVNGYVIVLRTVNSLAAVNIVIETLKRMHLFSSRGHYIFVFTRMTGTITESTVFLEHLAASKVFNVLLVLPVTSNEVQTFTWHPYHTSTSSCRSAKQVIMYGNCAVHNNWRFHRKDQHSENINFYSECSVLTLISPFPPFIFYKENGTVDGFTARILDVISNKMNTRLLYQQSPQGDPDYTFSGIDVSALSNANTMERFGYKISGVNVSAPRTTNAVRDPWNTDFPAHERVHNFQKTNYKLSKADISAHSKPDSTEENQDVERLFTLKYCWFVRRTETYPRWDSMSRVFTFNAWVCIFTSLILAALTFRCLKLYPDFAESLLDSWSIFLGIGASKTPEEFSTRIFFLSWVFYSLSVYVDRMLMGIISWSENRLLLKDMRKGSLLQIVVENQGRVYPNSNKYSFYYKGLSNGIEPVYLGELELYNWTMYSFPLDDSLLVHKFAESLPGRQFRWHFCTPTLYKTEFQLPSTTRDPADTYIDMKGWGKGIVWVNGNNLGRYWPSAGPQETLYLPGCYLKPSPEVNKMVVLELEKPNPALTVTLKDKPVIRLASSNSLNAVAAFCLMCAVLIAMLFASRNYAQWNVF
ncbi:hypothetical protein C0J52_19969 [Blattella germanica]|nr:hypothetical protein C0J52_19969 [Blattella germanica]